MPLTQQEQDLVDRSLVFAEKQIRPKAKEWERQRLIDVGCFKEAAQIGLTRIQVPQIYGGLGFSFSCKSRVLEVLAAADFGFAMSVVNSHNVAAKLAGCASPDVAECLIPPIIRGDHSACTALTESGAGSDFAAITTTAVESGEAWVLNGSKAWITNARHAKTIIVYAQTLKQGNPQGIAAFVIDAEREGFIRDCEDEFFGQYIMGAGGFRLKNYPARKNERSLPSGMAFKSVLNELNGARIYVASMCCGMVDAALREVSEYGKRRRTFGKWLSEHQAWRWTLAEASTALAAARHLVRAAELEFDQDRNVKIIAAQAKIFATRMAEHHIAALMHAMGAEGMRLGSILSRHLIASKMASLADGSTEMLLETVSRIYQK
jgi:alkylation response protein AidB-like acyl-CoA dehydrogenase